MSGKFGFQSRHEFQIPIAKEGQGGVRHLILNFHGVSFFDSAVLGMLATMYEQLTAQQIQVNLVSPQDYVKKVLELGRMDKYFSIYESEDQALSSMAKA